MENDDVFNKGPKILLFNEKSIKFTLLESLQINKLLNNAALEVFVKQSTRNHYHILSYHKNYQPHRNQYLSDCNNFKCYFRFITRFSDEAAV